MKNFLVAAILGTAVTLSAGAPTASAAVYRRPVVYRPYYGRPWVRPVVNVGVAPPVYTYPTYAPYYPYYPTYTTYPYYTPGVSVGLPGVGIRIR